MKKFLLWFLLIFSSQYVLAINPSPSSMPLHKKMEMVLGRKLSLREKIGVKILQLKFKKVFRTGNHAKPASKDRAKTALILGILGLVFLFIPIVNLASIPLGILAWVIGEKELKADPGNRKAKTAVLLGKITMAILLIAMILAIAILGFGTFGPR